MFGLNKRRFISTVLHNIVLTKYDASEFLFDYFDAGTEGLPGGYVVPLDSGKMVIANGRGEIFTLHRVRNFCSRLIQSTQLLPRPRFYVIIQIFGRFGLRDLYADLSEK